MTRWNLIATVLLLLLILLLGGGAFLFWNKLPQAQDQLPPAAAKELDELGVGGDFAALKAKSDALLQSGNIYARDAALANKAYAEYMQGGIDQQLDAVKIATSRYTSGERNLQKALAINQVIQFITISSTSTIFNTVFKNPPFNAYYQKNDYNASIAALAEESYALYPTTEGASYALLPSLAPLSNWGKVYKSTAAQKKAYMATIIAGLPRVDAGYAAEKEAIDNGQNTDVLVPYTYFYWESIFYRALAIQDPKYIPKAEESYQGIFTTYNNTKRPDGTPIPILSLRVVNSYFDYAGFLIVLGGADNTAQAAKNIKTAIQIINEDPSLHEHGGYIAYLRSVAVEPKGASRDADMRRLQLFASAEPSFRDFVKQYGVTLK